MAGGKQLDVAVGLKHRHRKGDEAVGGEIADQQIVQSCHQFRRLADHARRGPGVGAADRHHDRRADAVAGDVGENGHQPAVGQFLPVVVIPAGLVGGTVHARDVETGVRRAPGGSRPD